MYCKDFSKLEKSKVSNEGRDLAFSIVTKAMQKLFGEDSVTKVGNYEISIRLGIYKDDKGEHEVCFNLAPKMKEVFSHLSTKGDKKIPAYDRLTEGEDYRLEAEIKEKEKEEKKKLHDKRVQKAKELGVEEDN